MIPEIDASLVAAAYITGEVAEDFGAGKRLKLVAQLAGGVVAATGVYLAPTFPWLAQIGEAGLVAGLVAAGMVHGPSLLTMGKTILTGGSPTPEVTPKVTATTATPLMAAAISPVVPETTPA